MAIRSVTESQLEPEALRLLADVVLAGLVFVNARYLLALSRIKSDPTPLRHNR